MEKGSLLLLKEGILGLGKGENAGIYLGREKSGKGYIYTLFTLRGLQKLSQKNVVRPLPHLRFKGKENQQEMRRFLLEKVKPELLEREKKGVNISSQEILNKVKLTQLWQSVLSYLSWSEERKRSLFGSQFRRIEENGFSAEEIGKIYFYPKIPGEEHISALRTILSPCEKGYHGYFFRKVYKGKEHFIPYSKEVMTAVEEHIYILKNLKRYFVEWDEEKEEEKRERKKHFRLKVEEPSEVSLPEEMKKELNRLLDWAELYLKNADFNWSEKEGSVFGLAETKIRKLEDFDLEKFFYFFALDLSENPKLELPSALLTMLLIFKRLNYREASHLLLKYFQRSGKIHFHLEFKEHQLRAAERLPEDVEEEDLIGRKNLTHLETYTVDPVDAKDFDDAISFVVKDAQDKGNQFKRKVFELWVHIADVSHYVRPHNVVDDEARFRATSVYLPTGVLPMLPPKLSDNLCSLVSGKIRLAVSTRLVFDCESLELLYKEHFNSFIKVKRNLSYDYVDEKIKEGVEPFKSMSDFAKRLEKKYRRLDIGTTERKLRFSEDGNGFEVSLKEPTAATKMIEQFMVVTNEAVASTISEAGLPMLYRVHPLPEKEKVERFNSMCKALGYPELVLDVEWERVKGIRSKEREDNLPTHEESIISALFSGKKMTLGCFGFEGEEKVKAGEGNHCSQELPPMDREDLKIFVTAYSKSLEKIKKLEPDIKQIFSEHLLSAMPRALYSPSNLGHFGLNSLCYCHFTSPIRRYPDILVHRALKVLIAEKEGGGDCPWAPPSDDEVKRMADICNEQSQAAEELERLMVDTALAMRISREKEFRRKIYNAMVCGLTPTSIFLNMDGFTEGRLPLSRLFKADGITVDESEARILYINEKTGEEREILRLGERVRCVVHGVDIAEGKIDLSLKG